MAAPTTHLGEANRGWIPTPRGSGDEAADDNTTVSPVTPMTDRTESAMRQPRLQINIGTSGIISAANAMATTL